MSSALKTDVGERTTSAGHHPIAGVVLVLASILAAIGATWLSVAFGWPDVLDADGAEALPSFAAKESSVRAAFYLMLVSSLLLVPAAVYLEQLFGGSGRPAVRLVTLFGVTGAFAQILGWVRWPVTVPHLSDAYQAAPDAATREAVAASYDALNRYAGGALGEHLGWLFQGLWAIGIAVLLLAVVGVPRWLSLVGLGLAVVWWPLLVASGLSETDWLAPIGSLVSVVWFAWVLAVGVCLIVRRVGEVPTSRP